jgi:hypothetical protein
VWEDPALGCLTLTNLGSDVLTNVEGTLHLEPVPAVANDDLKEIRKELASATSGTGNAVEVQITIPVLVAFQPIRFAWEPTMWETARFRWGNAGTSQDETTIKPAAAWESLTRARMMPEPFHAKDERLIRELSAMPKTPRQFDRIAQAVAHHFTRVEVRERNIIGNQALSTIVARRLQRMWVKVKDRLDRPNDEDIPF